MSLHSPSPSLTRILRLVAAVLGAFALIVMILHAFLPARPVFGEPEAVGLQVDKIGPNSVSVEETITYTILITNASGTMLNGVVVTDTWNTQHYSGTYTVTGDLQVDSFTFTMQTLPRYAQWNLQPLAPGAKGSIQFNMVVTPAFEPRHNFGPTTFGNSVVITTSTPGVSAGNDNVDTLIVGPVLQVSKVYTPTNPRPGRLLTYTFLVTNLNRIDAITATNVVITEKLPNQTIFYAAYPPSIAYYDPNTNIVRWFLTGTLPLSSTTRVTLTVRVTPTVGFKQQIRNLKGNCGVYADAAPQNIPCTADVLVTPDEAFEKVTIATIPPLQSGTISKTYPNRIVTYTVYVYNPYEVPIADMLVTDTLPTRGNNVTQTFQYSGLLSSSPPALPTVIAVSSRLVAWKIPLIGGWGLYTFTYRAYAPPQMWIGDNKTSQRYQNQVEGSYGSDEIANNPGTGAEDDSMEIDVVPQVLPFKSVYPTEQWYGLPVTYTLVISNNGPTTITNIAITDVLPTSLDPYCAFEYAGFVSGTPPRFAAGNIVAWNPFTLTRYAQTTLATFRATVYGGPNDLCDNTVEGYSPDTYIVKWTNLARVKVKVPFAVNKTVNPTKVVLGGSVDYRIEWSNVGGAPATMNRITDVLPLGFFAGSQPIYVSAVSPPFTLLPYQGNFYEATFPVDVLGTPYACDTLPRFVQQNEGTVIMSIIDPPALAGEWANAVKLAALEVHPQARAYKYSALPGALPGEVMTFTIVLSNNTNLPIGQVKVTDTLPSGFAFGGVLPPTAAPTTITGTNVIWTNQDIPAGGTRSLVFTVTAPITPNTFLLNRAKASSTVDPLICIPKAADLNVPVKLGLIDVRKTATPRTVNPLGRIEYEITLKNIGPYTVTIARFTDTLPGVAGHVWRFEGMVSGPAPASTNPPAWTNLTIPHDKQVVLKFSVRTDVQVGTYPNLVATQWLTQPPAANGFMTASLPARWALTPNLTFTGTPVTVIPGVGVIKEVDRDAALAGETVFYTITLVNVSGNPINNVRITDTLPSGFTYETVLSGTIFPIRTSPLVWAIPIVASGEANKVVLAFRVKISNTQPTGMYNNQVAATADSIFIAPTGAVAPVRVSGIPALDMSKTVAPETAIAGREVTYTLTLANNDPDGEVINARITDTLPPNFSFTTMISGPNPAITTPRVVWTGVNVPTQTVATWVFRARVASSAPDGVYFNQVDGSSPQAVFNGTGQTAPVDVIATPTFDVQVSKSDDAPTATIGGTVVYTIYYTNTLNQLGLTAKNVVLTETFSPADYLTPDAPDWNLVSTGVYTRLIGDVPAGWNDGVTFALQIDPAIPEEYMSITNTVQIGASPPDDVPEAIEQPASNNISTDVDTIRGSDIVVVGFSVQPPNPQQGKPITVTVTVANQGVEGTLGPDTKGWFGNDLYIKPAGAPPPAGPADRYLGFCASPGNPCPSQDQRYDLYKPVKDWDSDGLAVGETYMITFTYVLPEGGIRQLYVQVDPFWAGGGDPDPVWGASAYGRIREANEQNNIYDLGEINVIGNVYLPVILKSP